MVHTYRAIKVTEHDPQDSCSRRGVRIIFTQGEEEADENAWAEGQFYDRG